MRESRKRRGTERNGNTKVRKQRKIKGEGDRE